MPDSFYKLRDSHHTPYIVEKRHGIFPLPDRMDRMIKAGISVQLEPVLQRMVDTHLPLEEMENEGIFLAWPTRLLFDEHSQLAGYIMRTLVSSESQFMTLDSIQFRNAQWDWVALHQLAWRIARTFAVLNHAGFRLADLPTQALEISASGYLYWSELEQLRLTDEYQFTSSFTQKTTEPESYDPFKLAVILFQGLMMGLHPFDGEWIPKGAKPTREIREELGLFPWLSRNHAFIRQRQPQSSFHALAPELQEYFHLCFSIGGMQPDQCPRPEAWQNLLETLLPVLPKKRPIGQKPPPLVIQDLLPDQETNRVNLLPPRSSFPIQYMLGVITLLLSVMVIILKMSPPPASGPDPETRILSLLEDTITVTGQAFVAFDEIRQAEKLLESSKGLKKLNVSSSYDANVDEDAKLLDSTKIKYKKITKNYKKNIGDLCHYLDKTVQEMIANLQQKDSSNSRRFHLDFIREDLNTCHKLEASDWDDALSKRLKILSMNNML